MQASEKQQIVLLLDELGKTVEELLLAGLTAASKSTIERLDVSFKEASRMKLLRLGSTLRIANEEIARFTTGATQFSPRRLVFFLGRAWLLASAMRRAIQADDQEQLNQLWGTPRPQPVEKLQFVTLGVFKRIVPGAFASFDFRLRAIGATGPVADREPLLWSCVFPLRKDLDLPAEAFLHLPQKQKFKPSALLERKIIEVTNCSISWQSGSTSRLILGESSTVVAGADFTDWSSFFAWTPQPASARLENFRPTPLDLEIELQEEVFLTEWEPDQLRATEEGYDLLPCRAQQVPFEMRLDRGPSGVPVHGVVNQIAVAEQRPPIYGVAHYEACKVILQPLSVLGEQGIEYMTVSPDKISQAELVKAMKFT